MLIQFKMPPAAQPDPFPAPVQCTVFDAMAGDPPIGDDLVCFQEGGAVEGVNPFAPKCGGILENFSRKAKLIDHGAGIAKCTGFHVADVQIVICALDQRVIQPVFVIEKGTGIKGGVQLRRSGAADCG